jgi:hypothetical protein
MKNNDLTQRVLIKDEREHVSVFCIRFELWNGSGTNCSIAWVGVECLYWEC